MKKALLTLLVLGFIFTNVSAQKEKDKFNCKSVKEKKDDFTGEITKTTSQIINFGNAIVGFKKAGEKYLVTFYVKFAGEKNAPLKEGEELQLKLESGEILTFKSIKDVAPTTTVSNSSTTVYVYSIYNAEYSCTVEDLQKLSNSPATNLKVTLANEAFPLKLIKMEGIGLQKDAYCILK
jgi:hypothetical protein